MPLRPQPLVVANKVQAGTAEISKADFEASIERKINFIVPLDHKAAVNAAKLGQTFVEANRSSKAGAVIRDIAKRVLGAGEEGEEAARRPAASSSLLGKFDLKSLLARRTRRAPQAEPAGESAGPDHRARVER